MIERNEGSSATKNRYFSLYANDEITAPECVTLCRDLDKRLEAEARAQMTKFEKAAEFVVRCIVAGLGGKRV